MLLFPPAPVPLDDLGPALSSEKAPRQLWAGWSGAPSPWALMLSALYRDHRAILLLHRGVHPV